MQNSHAVVRVLAVLVASAVLVLAVAPVRAQQPAPAPAAPMMPGMTADQGAVTGTPSQREMMAGMVRMNRAMDAAPMTGDPDRDFVAMMLPHHQGAIDMAQVELQYGKDPAMRRLARAIVAAQDKEIARMRRWQAGHPAPQAASPPLASPAPAPPPAAAAP